MIYTVLVLEISLKPELLLNIGGIQFTNTLFSSLLIFSLMTFILLVVAKNFNSFKPSKAQLFLELIVEALGKIFQDIAEHTYKSSKIFAFVLSFFIFILVSNWFGLLPFVGPLVLHKEDPEIIYPYVFEKVQESKPTILSCIKKRNCILTTDFHIVASEHTVPIFRAPTSDLSVTMALALLSVVTTNALGFTSLGISYFKKYINTKSAIDFVVGILELISEIGKIISFSFRLFGNIFAGEVLLGVIGFVSYGLLNLPFIGLEFFVGAIQALVFFMLTTVFVSLAKSQHH